MALFENYERRVDKINGVLAEYGIKSIEECREITLAKGIDCDKIVRETQPICFENAVWAYTVGAAIAIKKGCTKAKGVRYLEMAEGYVTRMALDEDDQVIGYEFVALGKMTDFIKKGDDPNTAYEKSKGTYGRFDDAAKYIDPRKE